MSKTRGQIEAEISEAIIKFEKEYMGRGPLETKTYIIEDMILIRMRGVLTKAEYQLASTDGRALIKRVRMALLEKGRPLLETVVETIVGQKIKCLHSDISTRSGEKIIIFTLDFPPKLE